MSKIAIFDDLCARLVRAGVIPNDCVAFAMDAQVGKPVKFTVTYYPTETQAQALTATLTEFINEFRNV